MTDPVARPLIRLVVDIRAIQVPGLFAADRTWAEEAVVIPASQVAGVDLNTIAERVVNRALAMSAAAEQDRADAKEEGR
jgi:hypothetical protein